MQVIGEREKQPETAFLSRRALMIVGLNWEVAAYLGIFVLAFVLRFWDLGFRMLHHDESIHAVYSWYLYTGRGYVHNPTFHGPFLYHMNALIYLLFGTSDYTARMAPAIFGLAMVPLPYLLRGQLGRTGAVVASFLLAISPSILYYSRSLRHDIFAAFATVLLVVSLWRYVEDRQPRWLGAAVGALLLTFTNHELSFITAFIFVTFLVFVTAGEWFGLLRAERQPLSGEADFLVLIATVLAPLFAPVVLVPLAQFGIPMVGPQATLAMWCAFAGLLAMAAIVGCWWNRRVWLYAAAGFYVAAILLFTGFFTNPRGVETGLLGSLQYWLTQHEVHRGEQPWYYYLLLLPLYEFVPLILGLAGVLYAFFRRNVFRLFLVYWFFTSLFIYSWAGEKMPWLVVHITIPLVMLAGLFVGRVIDKIDWRAAFQQGAWYQSLLMCILIAIVVGLLGLGSPLPSLPTDLEAQRHLLRWVTYLALLVLIAFLLVKSWSRVGRSLSAGAVAMAAFGVLLPLWVHTSLQVNFVNGDVSTEMLVYVQSSRDIGKVMREIERVGFRTGVGKDLKVAYDSDTSWPFEWYLRDYRYRNFYGTGLPARDAPVVLVGFEDNHDATVKAQLGDRYVGQRYKLRWWFPENYKSAYGWVRALEGPDAVRGLAPGSVGLGDVLRTTLKPESLGKLWNYFIYRQTVDPLGSTDFMLYIRKDLVSGLWGATATTGPTTAQTDAYEWKMRAIAPTAVWGAPGSGSGQFQSPKGVAVAPDGSLYVVDSRNNRIQKFDSSGQHILSWGEFGTGQGQFNEPWGVAVDAQGNVYVADWWNHRVQKFDGDGRFIAAWGEYGITNGSLGEPGVFYGPRSIAIDPKGNVYVADTGNHRIQVFDSSGRFLSQHGGRGSGDGQFEEPVGLAIDKDGYIFVADTWNRRIQRFDSSFNLVNQWPIMGWESESALNKPYLAVDDRGGLYVSDPGNHRLLKFSSNGTLIAAWGTFGSAAGSFNLPTGVACDEAGSVIVVDSGNNRVAKYAPVN